MTTCTGRRPSWCRGCQRKRDKERSIGELKGVAEVRTVILIILFNFSPHWIGIVEAISEGEAIIPVLMPEFAVYIPWLTAYWVLGILMKLYLLRQGCRSRVSRWMELGLGLVGLFITYRIVSGGPIITILWLNTLVRIFLWAGLLVGSIETIVRLVRLLREQTREPADDISDLKTSS